MKYTSLFSAVALAAAMSTQVLATPREVVSDNFNSYDLGGADSLAVQGSTISTPFNNKGWTVGTEDASEIVATCFDNGGQALKLNTNGETLSLDAQTTVDFTATVSMKVQMVSSDTVVDMSTDTTTQTAVFLLKEDEEAAAGTLMAFSSNPQEGNVWVPLTAEGFALDNGDTANISIVIDYSAETATYTVNGTMFPAIALANPNAAANHKLTSVAFKGTGYVDDLFVSDEQTGTFATFIYELAGTEQSNQRKNIADANFSVYSEIDFADGEHDVGYTASVALYERVAGEDDTWLADLALDENDQWTVTGSTYNFQENGTYVIKADFDLKSVTVNIVDDKGTADTDADDEVIATITSYKWFEAFAYTLPAGASISGWSVGQDDYEEEDPIEIASLEADVVTIVLHGYTAAQAGHTYTTADIVAGSLTWTAYDPAAGTATFTCTISAAPQQGDSVGEFKVLTAETFGGATTAAGTVTLGGLNGTAVTGAVSELPTDKASLFLVGLADVEAAPAAGE